MMDAKNIMTAEASAITDMIEKLTNEDFEKIVSLIVNSKGNIITSGMGKSGIIARKLAGTLSSLQAPAFFVHPSEALHGDLGKIKHEDIIIVISRSGETEELLQFVKRCRIIKMSKVIAIVAKPESTLNTLSTHTICTHQSKEAGGMLAPTTSATCALIVSDAIALCVAKALNYNEEHYKINHPDGYIS